MTTLRTRARVPAKSPKKKRAVPSLDQIMRDALMRATEAGYDRAQIAVAFIHMAQPLSGPSFDRGREAVAAACRLQADLIRDGFTKGAFARLVEERQLVRRLHR